MRKSNWQWTNFSHMCWENGLACLECNPDDMLTFFPYLEPKGLCVFTRKVWRNFMHEEPERNSYKFGAMGHKIKSFAWKILLFLFSFRSRCGFPASRGRAPWKTKQPWRRAVGCPLENDQGETRMDYHPAKWVKANLQMGRFRLACLTPRR